MPKQSHAARRPKSVAGDETAVRIMDGLRRLVQVLSTSARGTSSSGRQERLNGAQVFVLRQIAAAPGLSLGELAARTLARQSTVSEVVAKLVARRLVMRGASATDGRQATLSLTTRGRQVAANVEPTAQERLLTGLGALSADQCGTLAEGLEAWLGAAGLAKVPATMFFERSGAPRSRQARVTDRQLKSTTR